MSTTREQAVAAIAEELAEIAGVDPDDVAEDKTFAVDLNIDSLTMIEVVVAAEERFKITIPDRDVESIKTVRDLVDRAVAG